MASTSIRGFVCGMTAALGVMVAPACVPAAPCSEILMVGTSFSRGVSRYLRNFAQATGRELQIRSLARPGTCIGPNGGCGKRVEEDGVVWWERHHLRSSRTLREIAKPWSAVILQEQSAGLGAGGYNRVADLFDMHSRVTVGGSEAVLSMTWRDADIATSNACSTTTWAYEECVEVNSNNECVEWTACWDNLRATSEPSGYAPVARALSIPVAPIGWAFRQVKKDLETPGGEPGVDLWGPDGHHASARGKFLAAAVLYATLYHESPRDLLPLDPPVYPGTWSASEAVYLLGVADDVTLDPAPYTELGQAQPLPAGPCAAWGIGCPGRPVLCD